MMPEENEKKKMLLDDKIDENILFSTISDNNLSKIEDNIKEYNNKTKDKSNNLINTLREKIKKDKLIFELRQELAYQKRQNKLFKMFLTYTTNVTKSCKKNLSKIDSYCTNLKTEFQEDVKLIDSYENKIQDLKDDRQLIVESSIEIIRMKKRQKEKLNVDLEDINNKIKNLKKNYQESVAKYEEIKKNSNNSVEKLRELEKKYIAKISDITQKIKLLNLRAKYFEEVKNENFRIKFGAKNNSVFLEKADTSMNDEDELKIGLEEKKSRNEYLTGMVEKLNKKIIVMKTEENSRKSYSYITKSLEGKVKERKLMNEKLRNMYIKNGRNSKGLHKKYNSLYNTKSSFLSEIEEITSNAI